MLSQEADTIDGFTFVLLFVLPLTLSLSVISYWRRNGIKISEPVKGILEVELMSDCRSMSFMRLRGSQLKF